MRCCRVLALAAVLVPLVAACGRESVTPAVGLSFTPPSPGVMELVRAELAQAGGRLDAVRLVVAPQGSGLAWEVRRAAYLAGQPGVAVVVGHNGSRASLLAAPIYDEAGLPLVVPMATSRRLRTAAKAVFRLVPDDSVEGAFIGRFVARHIGARSVTIVYSSDEYGIGLRNGVEAAVAALGLALTDAVPVGAIDCPRGAADPYALMARASLRRGRPDVVVIATPSLTAGCVVRGFRGELPRVAVVLGDGAEPNRDFTVRAGTAADSTYFVTFWHPDADRARSAAFLARFEAVAGRAPQASEALWYDAIMLAAGAVRAVGGNRARVSAYLREMGSGRPAYEGVTGTIAFAAMREAPLVALRYADSALAVVAW